MNARLHDVLEDAGGALFVTLTTVVLPVVMFRSALYVYALAVPAI